MHVALLLDFGSTYTKVVAVDLDAVRLLGTAQAPSTVESDVTVGLREALAGLAARGVPTRDPALLLGSSSAAGGLRMVALGMVPALTVEAARRAALGAGAKVIKVYGYKLSLAEVAELEVLAPDVILLAGGTDGGDSDTILTNARALAATALSAPVVVAGNKSVSAAVVGLLQEAGKDARLTENVLPELHRLNVERAQRLIREIFIERIVEAKGLDRVRRQVADIIMPTPMAVLRATELLADGPPGAGGLGEVMVVDIGGATTDVHTVASGAPTVAGAVLKGLPEPRTTRTVEGDLGLRVNAVSVLETAESAGLLDGFRLGADRLPAMVERLARETAMVPETDQDYALDAALAAVACGVATDRHAGRVEEVWTVHGKVCVQYGKDLRALPAVVGTGGIFAYGHHGREVLAAATRGDPLRLKPAQPRFYIDRRYIMYAAGLLAERHPTVAYKVLADNLVEV